MFHGIVQGEFQKQVLVVISWYSSGTGARLMGGMLERWSQFIFRRLVPAFAVAGLLASAVAAGVIHPQVVAAEAPTSEWIRQFGGALDDHVRGISADANGVYIASWTDGAPCIHKYDASGAVGWLRLCNEGTPKYEVKEAVAISACSSGIYVTGDARNVETAETGLGFVRKYNFESTENWTSPV
jgi:hypothetical protein